MKTLHIISHTHWDREWYLPFETQRLRLVDLMDTLLDTLDNNPRFLHFHMDGQVVAIEDYLELRPENLPRIQKQVREGRLAIGPWYVLQDEFLTSGEANVRNMLIGLREAQKYGGATMIGYFPDSFGNISQAPQILRGFGIDTAVFGRGINGVHFNNTISASDMEQEFHSEVDWKSPDGSSVLGVMFANWYHNAMEIPSDRAQAIERFRLIVSNAEHFASTYELLGMNGCDHEPVQTDIGDIILDLSTAIPGIRIIHSSFQKYFEALKQYGPYETVVGELTEQHTDGLGSLVNTASSRIYLKQKNHAAQNALEKYAEPLSVISMLAGGRYRDAELRHAWKLLLQNHAHDSICGCSVDEVHRECMTRFEKSMAISQSIGEKAFHSMASKISTLGTKDASRAGVVYNPNGWSTTQSVEAFVDLNRDYNRTAESLSLMDSEGGAIPCDIEDLGETFTYELPENRFREVKYVRRLRLRFCADQVPSLGWRTYYLTEGKSVHREKLVYSASEAENEFVRLRFATDGSFTITNKDTGAEFAGLNVYEDSGDVGDEYIYRCPEGTHPVTTLGGKARISIFRSGETYVTYLVINKLSAPSARKGSSDKRHDKAIRIETYVTLTAAARYVEIKTVLDNHHMDHRVRALFTSRILSKNVCADTQFEWIERNIEPWSGWKRPENTERQQAFFELSDNHNALIIANRGLHEYEILRDGQGTMALTLLRCVGELGDWGCFPTPEAQCERVNIAEYAVIAASTSSIADARRLAMAFSNGEFRTLSTGIHTGVLPDTGAPISILSRSCVASALKKAESNGSDVILRVYNPSAQDDLAELCLSQPVYSVFLCNLNEEIQSELEIMDKRFVLPVPAKCIRTILLRY